MRELKLTAFAAVLAACVACGGNGEEVPALEDQSVTPPRATSIPETVQGCLGAGGTDGTYVLTAGAGDTGTDAATYQLEGTTDGLAEHIGRRVEVTGTVVSEQVARSRGASMPAADGSETDDEAIGTSGTPTVQSTTEVEVKRLQVTSVLPIDADCGDEDDGR